MLKQLIRAAVVGAAALVCVTSASAQSSLSTVTFQGVLSDSGAPVADGAYTITFKVYDAASGGTLLQTIAVPNVQTTQGRFSALVPVNATVFSGADRWWSVSYQGVELLPRQKVTATPYALTTGAIANGSSLFVRHDEESGYAAIIDNFHVRGQGLRIRASDGGGPWRLLRVDDFNGNLRFEVNADGKTTVKILEILGGSDLAEPFPASPTTAVEPKPGMVMSIDPDHPGALTVSTAAYDTKVAGVYSGANGLPTGMLMGHDANQLTKPGDGNLPIAMSGRVWVYADPSGGEIKPGDRLTTSGSKPGYAMKAADSGRADGAVLGKAMTTVDQQTGMVLVLVNLQ